MYFTFAREERKGYVVLSEIRYIVFCSEGKTCILHLLGMIGRDLTTD